MSYTHLQVTSSTRRIIDPQRILAPLLSRGSRLATLDQKNLAPAINRPACHAPESLVKLHTMPCRWGLTSFRHNTLRNFGNVACVATVRTYPALPSAVPGLFAVCQPAGIPYGNARENPSGAHSHSLGSSAGVVGLQLCQPRLA
jgi:hypothetical protein